MLVPKQRRLSHTASNREQVSLNKESIMKLPNTLAKELPFDLPSTFLRDTVCTLALIGIIALALLRG
jgi:hypothetical protein